MQAQAQAQAKTAPTSSLKYAWFQKVSSTIKLAASHASGRAET
jgi:hypothetical protein